MKGTLYLKTSGQLLLSANGLGFGTMVAFPAPFPLGYRERSAK